MNDLSFSVKETGKRTFVARVKPGEELVDGIKQICVANGITSGAITSILGNLKSVKFTYPVSSNSKSNIQYREPIDIEGPIEIVTGSGMIGLDNGELFVHLHLSFCDIDGKASGGHILEKGNTVGITAEFVIEVFDNVKLERGIDESSDMPVFTVI